MRPSLSRRDDDFFFGTLASVVGHAFIFAFVILHLNEKFGPLPAPTIYSITLEGGKNIGGISQIPTKDKTPLAPAKNVSADKTDPKDVTKPIDKQIEKTALDDDAEVSLTKPTPVPATPAPTPKTTPVAKTTPAAKATPKSTPIATPSKSAKQVAADLNKDYQKAMQLYLGESTQAGGQGFGAAKIGGNSMGGGVVRPPEFFTYRDLLQRHVKHEWRWYDNRVNLVTQVAFELDPDGTMRNMRIVTGSGNREFDDSVMRALVKANPAPAPPASIYQQYFKTVTTYFDPRE